MLFIGVSSRTCPKWVPCMLAETVNPVGKQRSPRQSAKRCDKPPAAKTLDMVVGRIARIINLGFRVFAVPGLFLRRIPRALDKAC